LNAQWQTISVVSQGKNGLSVWMIIDHIFPIDGKNTASRLRHGDRIRLGATDAAPS
jgi:hypothetical protein